MKVSVGYENGYYLVDEPGLYGVELELTPEELKSVKSAFEIFDKTQQFLREKYHEAWSNVDD
jgi:hypothetical protein